MRHFRAGPCFFLGALSISVLALPGAQTAPTLETDIRRDATVAAVEEVMPSVVNIATETIIEYKDFYQSFFLDFFGRGNIAPQRERRLSVGSGVIIDEEGYVLTNLHVVRRANRTQVKLWDGREYDAIPIVATEHSDVALLKIRAKPGEKFKAVKFGLADDLLLGETVLALGNPFGLGGTVTKGILSSKSRRPPSDELPLNVQDWLQTDAAINPGNSGGPLINLRGELIGLSVAVLREGQGIGFAIPVKMVSEALAGFFSPEVTGSLWLGVHLKAVPNAIAVEFVQPGSPAEKGGLRVGDQIVAANGHAPGGVIHFNRLITDLPEHKFNLTVQRESERKNLSIIMMPFDEMIRQKTGLGLRELTKDETVRLGVQGGKGLIIDEIDINSPAEKGQLQRGYLLTEIDGQSVSGTFPIGNVLSSKQKGEHAHLTVVAPRRIAGQYIEFRQGTVDLTIR
jgi:S1-C subfamily serine protease